MRIASFLLLLLVSCDTPQEMTDNCVHVDNCAEADWHTTRNGEHVTCRILWCGYSHGGPATLWCDHKPKADVP